MPPPVPSTEPTWSALVRYAGVDQQGIAFNAHYLTWCDEAMGAFCTDRGLLPLAERLHVVASTQTWTSSARWGDVVDVHVSCGRVGRSSLVMSFAITVGDRSCCAVETTYVYALDGGAAQLPDDARVALAAG